ncbi:unnamed protein product [Leptidea sinapis]|uniref:Sulfotransferase domain-containing protein n=1 Tax=Leptidea sinapis TaxID=189913 RepID=A0A5E4PNE5_9NEOP|nr:unnamed protein product [Leptidea sinapis]
MLEITTSIPEVAFELIKINFMNLADFQGLNEAVKYPSWKSIEEAPSPRFIKTHLPLSLLPPNLLDIAKVLYVARDPRDTMVSYYYLNKMVARGLMTGTFAHYWEAFRRDLLPWTPTISHANEAWEKKTHPNLHFMFYENMLQDLPAQIREVSKFLNKDISEVEIEKLADHLSFANFKKNKNVNNTAGDNNNVQFVRKGNI